LAGFPDGRWCSAAARSGCTRHVLDPTGRKMSKTIGNTIKLDVLGRIFQSTPFRYFCLRNGFWPDGGSAMKD